MDDHSYSSLEIDGCLESIGPRDLYCDVWTINCHLVEFKTETKRKREPGGSTGSSVSTYLFDRCNDDGDRHSSSGNSSSSDSQSLHSDDLSRTSISSYENAQITKVSDPDPESQHKLGEKPKAISYSSLTADNDSENSEPNEDKALNKTELKTKVEDTTKASISSGIYSSEINVTCFSRNENEPTESQIKSKDRDSYTNTPNKNDDEVDSFTQDEDGDTLLHDAIICYKPLIARALIEVATQNDLNVMNDMFQTPLHLAVLTKQYNIVDNLLAASVCIHLRDKKGRTPLHIACELGEVALVRKLLQSTSSCQIADTQESPSNMCALSTSQLMKLPNNDGKSCIHIACMSCRAVALMMLLTIFGADINQPDCKSGRTVLHLAVESGYTRIVESLLEIDGIDVNKKTRAGETALAIAYHRNHTNIKEILIRNGAIENLKYLAKFGLVRSETKKRCKVGTVKKM